MAAGTPGDGEERYGIYLPFELPIGRELKVEPGGSSIELANTQFTVERLHHRYAIHGGGFLSKLDAEAFLNDLRTSLLWFSLTHRLGLRYPETNSDCTIYEEPNQISPDNKFTSLLTKRGWTASHGDFNADQAVIKPEHLCLTRWETGRVSVRTDLALDRFVSAIAHANQLPNLRGLRDHPRTRLAIEVYASVQFESSDQAQFLVLVAALEATLESQKVSDPVLCAVEAATGAVQELIESMGTEASDPEPIRQFITRLQSLKEASIAQKIRDQIAKNGGELEPWKSSGNLEAHLKDVYSTRSRLLHDGTTDAERIKSGLAFLREFVPAYLVREFNRAASAL